MNIAKNNHDDRAFSHHVYGLLRGLQGNVEEAKFELGLARARETHESAIKRIDLALKVLDLFRMKKAYGTDCHSWVP